MPLEANHHIIIQANTLHLTAITTSGPVYKKKTPTHNNETLYYKVKNTKLRLNKSTSKQHSLHNATSKIKLQFQITNIHSIALQFANENTNE